MKKLLLTFSLVVIGLASAIAQSAHQPRCFTDEYYREAVQQDPEILRIRQELEDFTRQYVADKKLQRTSNAQGSIYVIPVVFHVLHEYGDENISEAQILDCLMNMNRDFRKLNPDTINIIPQYQPIAADAQIEFRLATKDPNGNCTNGIDRIFTPKTNSANNSSKLNPWPNNMYLNIWVAKTLENTGAAAYAHLPGTVPGTVDGIMSRYDYIGTIGAGGPSGLHTISHETGHHLNLLHPWGSTNEPGVSCGDDFVMDTPETQGWTSCNLNGSICNPPVIENVQNFMEYSYCDNMFTNDQRDRMHSTLNSPISGRNNLWTQQNLLNTGTDGTVYPPCVPIADFYTFIQAVCVGSTIDFKDFTWNATPTTYTWLFPGGTPSTSADQNPSITYNTPGLYDVSLIVSNATGTDTLTRAGFIRVSGPAAISTVPFLESFDTPASLPGVDGWIVNPDNGTTWQHVTTAGANGTTTSIRINNYTNTAGQIDEYITSSFDISNLTQPVMRFWVANAQRNTTSSDELRVFTSSTCGQTWVRRYTKAGAALATAGVRTTSFTPTSTQWRLDSILLNAVNPRTNVRFKFMNTSDRGNNTFIDEIQITGNIVNVDEIDEVTMGYALFPNPSQGTTTIQFKLSSAQEVDIQVRDLTGRVVKNVLHQTLGADLHEIPFTLDANGIYLVDVNVSGKHHVRRLVIAD